MSRTPPGACARRAPSASCRGSRTVLSQHQTETAPTLAGRGVPSQTAEAFARVSAWASWAATVSVARRRLWSATWAYLWVMAMVLWPRSFGTV